MTDLDVAACHGQRSVDRAPALEPGDELRGLGRIRATEPQRDLDGREYRHVRPGLPIAVDAALHRDRHVLEGDLRVPREDLEDLGPAGRGGGEEELSRRRGLAGTAVLHGTVHDETVLTDGAAHTSEDGCRLRVSLVDAHGGLHHGYAIKAPVEGSLAG